MTVKCVRNKSKLFPKWRHISSTPLDEILVIGERYTVYGIIFAPESIYYEILTMHTNFTFSYPSFFFEVDDNRLSKYFCFGQIESGNNTYNPFISFKEWVNDSSFFSRLVDGDKDAKNIFSTYQSLLDSEYQENVSD
jgi:hypothetical protein